MEKLLVLQAQLGIYKYNKSVDFNVVLCYNKSKIGYLFLCVEPQVLRKPKNSIFFTYESSGRLIQKILIVRWIVCQMIG